MKKLTLITLGCLFSVTAFAANASKVCDEYFTEIDEMVKLPKVMLMRLHRSLP